MRSVEPNITFLPQASLGLPFALGGFHQTYLQLMRVEEAHQCAVKGKDIAVAVVDSGADPNMKKPVDDFYDFQHGAPVHPANPIDNDGHGTAMATLIQEVAPEAKVFAARVFKEDKVNLWNLLAGAGVAAFDCKVQGGQLPLYRDLAAAGFATILTTCVDEAFPLAVGAKRRKPPGVSYDSELYRKSVVRFGDRSCPTDLWQVNGSIMMPQGIRLGSVAHADTIADLENLRVILMNSWRTASAGC